jgi:steroid 5-alpha reductase family enzyme
MSAPVAAMAAALAVDLAVAMVGMLLLWLLSIRLRDVSFIDAVWAYGMVALAWCAAAQAGGVSPHAMLILSLVTLWGLRLGTHLLLRWRGSGVDPRYARIIGGAVEKRGWSFARAALQLVFLVQGPLLWFVSLPAQVGVLADAAPLGVAAWIGAALALVGIAFESIGDAQLAAFRRDPANRGRVLDSGLWRYTRHPNYFGDACTWWGLWLIAADAGPGLWTLLSPLFLTWTLTRWSGAALLERGLRKSRPDYAAYVARTSAFLPWPPKRG